MTLSNSYFLLPSPQAGPSQKMMCHPLTQPWVLGVGVANQTHPAPQSAGRKVCDRKTFITVTSCHSAACFSEQKKLVLKSGFKRAVNWLISPVANQGVGRPCLQQNIADASSCSSDQLLPCCSKLKVAAGSLGTFGY